MLRKAAAILQWGRKRCSTVMLVERKSRGVQGSSSCDVAPTKGRSLGISVRLRLNVLTKILLLLS